MHTSTSLAIALPFSVSRIWSSDWRGCWLKSALEPALCATGSETGRFRQAITQVAPDAVARMVVLEGVDFCDIHEQCVELGVELVIGNSKGFKMAREMNVPLVRVGFPIHDRIGGPRLLHVGYRGTQQLFDRITNALIAARQASSNVGYTYM